MEEETRKEDVCEKLLEHSENKINEILDQESITRDNIMYLGQVVDVLKDTKNMKYWKEKIDIMRYSRGSYGNYSDDMYGRGRSRDSRGRYMESSRGGRYRGDDYLRDMDDNYGRYMEGRGRYGHDEDSKKSLEYMLESAYDFMEHIADEAKSPDEMEIVRKYARKISEI